MTTRDSPQSSSPQRRPSFWPWGITLGLASVVTVNLSMVYIAVQNPSIPETDDHWAESLAFNEQVALRRESLEHGWILELSNCSTLDANEECTLELRVIDRQGQAVRGLQGRLLLRRGDQQAADREVELQAHSQGYRATFPPGPPGHYTARVLAKRGAQQWQASQELRIDPGPFPGRHS